MANYQVLGFAVVAVVFLLLKYLNHTDVPKIKNLSEIPGLPLFGNLIQLGNNHARVAGDWAKKYGPVFQTRLGNRRVIFANTYESVKHLWITNQSALISRPTLHTFHTVVSSSQGFTIGTSPWDESCKRRRKAAATALNRPAVQSYMPILDLEATTSIKEMLLDSEYGQRDINPIAYFQRFALNTSLTLNYGFRIKGNVKDDLLREIVHVERQVSNFRSTSNNWQDYVPLLRLFPSRNNEAAEYRRRRDVYMDFLLQKLKDRVAAGTDKPCISGNILKDPDAKLSEAEIKSIGLTMVSAGLDTVPGNLIMCLAYLSSEDGQRIQNKALAEIEAAYPGGDAWEKCLVEEKVSYITALVREVLRFWSVIPICLPRVSIKDISYGDAVIPAGTTFYMNAWAANYDESHFADALSFRPERYLSSSEGGSPDSNRNTLADDDKDEVSASGATLAGATGTPHFGYGAGSRMCAGSHLANRELYTAFLRIILAFEIVASKNDADRPILDALACNAIPTSLTMELKPFKIGFKVRDRAALERWIAASEERTKDL